MFAHNQEEVAGRGIRPVLTLLVTSGLALAALTALPVATSLSGTDLRAQLVAGRDVGSAGVGPGANPAYWSEHLTPPDQVVAILAGRLFEANSGTMLTDQVVLINGERIVAVGPDVDIPSGATVVDLSDATVLPGMIDTHVHVFPAGGTEHQRAFTAVANGMKSLNCRLHNRHERGHAWRLWRRRYEGRDQRWYHPGSANAGDRTVAKSEG